jgi:hypothetical protein
MSNKTGSFENASVGGGRFNVRYSIEVFESEQPWHVLCGPGFIFSRRESSLLPCGTSEDCGYQSGKGYASTRGSLILRNGKIALASTWRSPKRGKKGDARSPLPGRKAGFASCLESKLYPLEVHNSWELWLVSVCRNRKL